MQKFEDITYSSVKEVASKSSNKTAEPSGYPFISKAMLNESKEQSGSKLGWNMWNAEIEAQHTAWLEYRHACANKYPSSSFAIEERVLDGWNKFCGDDRIPMGYQDKQLNVGGFYVSMRPKWVRAADKPEISKEGCSEKAWKMFEQISSSFNPASHNAPAVKPDFLRDFVSLEGLTEKDIKELMPVVLLKWRQLCSGSLRREYNTPDNDLSDKILSKCVEVKDAKLGIHLLRHKMAFKLMPTMESIEALMSVLLKEVESSEKIAYTGIKEEDKKEEVGGKRKRVARKDYPFRQAPRFYFYKPLPYVLGPEPTPFAEFSLPELPNTNNIKRLLPDDKLLKVKMEIEKEESIQNEMEQKFLEIMTPVDRMFQLYYYATSDSPRYYNLEASEKLQDMLKKGCESSGVSECSQFLEEKSKRVKAI
ncbi:hypothetical protein MP638_000948 [Amoeboaphelidium occidentale]|nr:hypothetical protein MP638_000948 [Amoeboaphelidium occidentale]